MNTVFNINRFWQLEKRNLFLSKSQYLYLAKGLIVLYILSIMLNTLTEGTNLIWLINTGIVVVIIAGPCFFEQTRNRHSSIFDFTLPASTFEKFLSTWSKYVIVLPLMIFLILTVLNFLTGFVPVEWVKEHAQKMSLTDSIYRPKTFFILIFFQSIYMGGYYIFRKYAFPKTSLILICSFIAIIFFGIVLGHSILDTGSSLSFNASDNQQVAVTSGYGVGQTIGTLAFASDTVIKTAGIIIDIVVPAGMWIVSFFKLRETEI